MATLASTYNTRRLHARTVAWEVTEPSREQATPQTESIEGKPRETAAARSRRPAFDFRPALAGILNALHRALGWGFKAVAGFFFALFCLQFSHPGKWDGTWVVAHFRAWGDPIVAGVASWVGSRWPNSDSVCFVPLGIILFIGVLKLCWSAAFTVALNSLRPRAAGPEEPPEAEMRHDEHGIPVSVDSEQARDELLRRYREIEEALKSAKRKRCAFLSIDIAGSTKMKESEQAMAVDVTFQAYMKMLDDIFARYGAWKTAWTPDGVMACFLHIDVAAAAAQSVLRRLRAFNRTENLLRTRMAVRCGLSEGEVSIFEDTKLEKFAHPVMDAAGQMQRYANPDSLWVSAEVFNHLDDKSGFRPAERPVDGNQAYEWSARLAALEPLPLPLPAAQRKSSKPEATWA